MQLISMLIMMLACSGEPEDTSPADTDSGTITDSGGTDTTVEIPDETYGQVPDESLPAPEFAATNYDGSARGITDLTDGPTVMWFFPAAGTYG